MPVFSRFLRYFIVVAQHGSIRKASHDLNIAASAIDRQILQVEHSLGTPLFERLPMGLKLTAAGEFMLAAGTRWTHDLRTLTDQIDNLKGLKEGTTDLLIPNALTKGFVPDMLGRLRRSHPGIIVKSHIHASQDMGDILLQGKADCALIFNPRPMKELSILAQKEIPLGFITLPNHPIATMKDAPFHLCASYPMVMPIAPLALCRPLEQLEAETDSPINSVAYTDNTAMIKSLVTTGTCISILSYLDVYDEIKQKKLSFTPIAHETLIPLTIALCVHKSRQLSASATLVISEMDHFFSNPI